MSQRPRSQGQSSQGSGAPPDENTSSLAAKAVHFFLAHAGAHNTPVKYTDLKKAVFPDSKVDEPLKLAEKMLKETFGYKLRTLTVSKSTKLYFLTNTFTNENHIKLPKHTQGYRSLLAIILGYIFMNRGAVEQRNLLKFLQQIGIGIDQPHPYFGNVAELIYKYQKQDPILVKDYYLTINESEQGTHFSWGPRAEAEVDRDTVLQVVCEILGDDIRDWRMQAKDAEDAKKAMDED